MLNASDRPIWATFQDCQFPCTGLAKNQLIHCQACHFHDSVESHIRGLTELGKSEELYGLQYVIMDYSRLQ